MFGNIDWARYIEYLRTENILEVLSSVDPLELVKEPLFLIPALIVTGCLVFFKFYRTLSVIVGLVALWLGDIYGLPGQDEGLSVTAAVKFGSVCLAVAALWIYVFLIRND